MKRVVCWIAVTVALAITACEKKDSPGASGALSGAELDLFRRLPAGNQLVLGGSYAKLQGFMQRSALGRMSRESAETLGGKALVDWIECFANKPDLRIAAGARLGSAGGGELRMVIAGMGMADLTTCAKQASLKITADPDGKYASIEIPGPSGSIAQGFLVVGTSTLYTRGALGLGMGLGGASAARGDLENDLASAAKGNVASDAALQRVIAKVDRSKTAWFAGSAADTPYADKLGEVYGSLDIRSGFAFDVVVQFTDAKLQSTIEDNVDQVKRMADRAPTPEMKSLVEKLVAQRIGDRMRFALTVSDAELDALLNMSGGLFGGGMAP